MKTKLPLALCFLTGMFMFIQYFSPHPGLERMYRIGLNWMIVIGIFATGLGIASLWSTHWTKIKRHDAGWGYSVVTLVALVVMTVAGLSADVFHLSSFEAVFDWLYDYVMAPAVSTMFALLAFFIASAAYRAFRAHNLRAATMLVTAVIVMMGVVPLGNYLSDGYLQKLATWLLLVPNVAAKRAIILGVGMGAASMALKIMLGIERSYLGGGGK